MVPSEIGPEMDDEELLAEVEGELRSPDEDRDIDSLIMQGLTLLARDLPDEAAPRFSAVLAEDPTRATAHLGLGRVLEARGRLALATLRYQTASSLNPRNAEAFVRLGDVYMAQGKSKPALSAYDRALRADPRSAPAHYHEALTLLAEGSYGRGWRAYEWRWRVPDTPDKRAELPLWDGKLGDGRRVMIEGEGGTVEQIFYAHCIGDVLTTGARASFQGDAALSTLLRRSFTDLDIVNSDAPPAGFDAAIPLGSLPGLFRRRLSDFKRPPGYLVADLRATTTWRERYRALGPGLKLGLAWRGDVTWPCREAPHLPLRALAPLLDVEGIHGASLEPSPTAEAEVLAIQPALQLGYWPERDGDLDGLAARIDACDLVVAPPGVIAALAGALGKPVFVLTPTVPGWLWRLGGRKLPWFPTMTLLRSRSGHGWDKVVAGLAVELQDGPAGHAG